MCFCYKHTEIFFNDSRQSKYICAMAGIYIHIPFCKQKCSYCNFHFSTDLKFKSNMAEMIALELFMRKDEILEPVETIYFGGGTPSLLNSFELELIFNSIYKNYSVNSNPEITIETNPDDLTEFKIKEFKSFPFNRFSIGIQSFFDEDLKLMNRAHNSEEAIQSVKIAQENGFENITIDLIYGGQTTSDMMWQKNLEIALDLEVPHISSYALTVEPKTSLAYQIATKKWDEIDEDRQERQFHQMIQKLTEHDFVHYEISNFGKEGFFSQHNSNYWKGKSYLGVGPSAHSFDGKNRSWNPSNNSIYLKNVAENKLVNNVEVLSENDKFNELIMIRLRTIYGLNLSEIKRQYPEEFLSDFLIEIQPHLDNDLIRNENDIFYLTEKGKFLADGIAASLFRI